MELADTALNQQAARLRVAILGCTGSIGTQALDVCRQHADRLQVVACSAHSRTEDLVRFAREFSLSRVAVTDPDHANDPILSELPRGCACYTGPDAALSICLEDDVDCVLVAIVGAAGLAASAAVLSSGKRLALANKESLVVGGDLLMPLARKDQLIPVDSEHSAIFQCYLGEDPRRAHAIWLTCSGGPFYGYTRDQLSHVTVADALAHPTWNMGAKITIDSATLLNKGYEVIEAHWLYGAPFEKIGVVVHPESIVHSLVGFADGTMLAQLGYPDMRVPIQLAFTCPERLPCERPLDLAGLGKLTFLRLPEEKFPCYTLALAAGRAGGTLPTVLNGAAEEAVHAFLRGRITFPAIADTVKGALDAIPREEAESYECLAEADARARACAHALIYGTSAS